MRLFDRIVKALAAVAAVLVIAYASTGLWARYQTWQWQKRWQQETPSVDETHPELEGVSVSGEPNLTAFVSAFGEELLSFKGDAEAIVVPVVHNATLNTKKALLLTGGSLGLNWYSVGACDENPIVNLVYYEFMNGSSKTLYDRRVFIPAFGVVQFSDQNSLISLVVDEDSNQDGRLTCQDVARLEIQSLETGKKVNTGIEGLPEHFSSRQFNGDNIIIVLDRWGEGGAREPTVYRLNVTNGEFVTIEQPDFLSEAEIAFRRTSND